MRDREDQRGSGYSHSTRNLSQHMKEYFTHERIVDFVERCESMGINAWQTGHGPDERIVRALGTLRERGSKIHWFCLAWEGEGHRGDGPPVSRAIRRRRCTTS